MGGFKRIREGNVGIFGGFFEEWSGLLVKGSETCSGLVHLLGGCEKDGACSIQGGKRPAGQSCVRGGGGGASRCRRVVMQG